MAIKVVLIIGAHNSGKSTLVRTLSGKGKDHNRHPFHSSITKLVWGAATQPPTLTLCLNSSLNEGPRYPIGEKRTWTQGGYTTVAPWDLKALLDIYATEGCKKAILCITIDSNFPDWTVFDYAQLYNQGGFGAHEVIHVVSLADPAGNLANFNGATHFSTNGRDPANAVAALVRPQIGLL